MKLLEDQFNLISAGKKTIEVRIFDEKRQELDPGDIIEFYKLPNLKEKIKVEIVALLKYISFKGLINDFGMEYYGYPNDYPIEEFMRNIYKIYSIEKEKEKEYGVLGIQLKLIN